MIAPDIKIKAMVRKLEYFDHVVFVWEIDNETKVPSYAIVEVPPTGGGEVDAIIQ